MEECLPGSIKKRSKLKTCLKIMMSITLPVFPSGIAYPPMSSIGRGKKLGVPRQILIPTIKGKHHDEGVYEGVGFPQIKSIRVKCKMDHIKNQFAGALYSTKQGVIKLQFDDNAPPPPKMKESHTDGHILGIIIFQKYGLKKWIELFREESYSAVVKELTQKHELDTYEPIMASDLS